MNPDHPPPPDSDTSPDSPSRHQIRSDRSSGGRHRANDRLRDRLRETTQRLLTWLRAALGTAARSNLHRVHPRMRALQLGSAGLAVGVLAVLVGGMHPAQHEPVDLAASPRPLNAPVQGADPVEAWAEQASATTDVPPEALQAYVEAARAVQQERPGCDLPWTVLAGIGKVESDHARFGGAELLDNGRPSDPIIGIPLDGSGVQAVTDSDDGRLDSDSAHDRAVGPMQFIPATWQAWSVDGNDDGATDPQNLYDAAATAGNYLCGAVPGQSLDGQASRREALMTYNQSSAYGDKVLRNAERYARADAPPTTSA